MKITDHQPRASALQGSIAEAVTRDHVRAVSEYKRGENQSALRCYRRILCADPGDRIASVNLVWIGTRDDLASEAAVAAGRWALRRFPDNLRLKYLLGRTLFWRGKISETIPLLGATASEGPDPGRAYSMLGHAVTLRRDVADNPGLGGPVPAASGPRLVALVRDMISLDHILPVVWRWSEAGTRDAVIIFVGAIGSIDWRITAARSMPGVHVRSLLDLAADLDINAMVEGLLVGATERVVVFDKSNEVIARVIGGAARRHGAVFVCLPHGEEAFANKLTQVDQTAPPSPARQISDLYDLSVHSSDFTIVKYELPTGPHVTVLGSARYCQAWLRQSRRWLRPAEGLPDSQGMRIVLFLPKPEKIVDWRELERVLSLLASRPGVALAVKAHPRRGGRNRLVQRNGCWDLQLIETAEREILTNIKAPARDAEWFSVPPALESSPLVEWADVILALGTSVTWEAVATNKPVLELSWCHGNRTTMATFLPSTDMRSRDDLLEALDRIARDGPAAFYPREERDAFIERFIEPNRQDGEYAVLDAYVATLERVSTRPVAIADKNDYVG